jgi:hypothetical protein
MAFDGFGPTTADGAVKVGTHNLLTQGAGSLLYFG